MSSSHLPSLGIPLSGLFGRHLLSASALLLSLAASLLVPGCAAGVVGSLFAISSSDGGAGPAVVNVLPLPPSNVRTARIDGDTVLVEYNLADADGGPLLLAIAWRPSGGGSAFYPAHGLNGLKGTAGQPLQNGEQTITVPPNVPTTFTFFWEARQDVSGKLSRSAAEVIVRISATEAETGSSAIETEPFVAGNNPPAIAEVRQEGNSGFIPVRITIVDSTKDLVKLNAYIVFVDELGQNVRVPATWKGGRVDYESLPEGKEHLLFWDSESDVGQLKLRASLELTPEDFGEAGPTREFSIDVDNNNDPEVQLLDVAASWDKSFEIPVRFLVRDEESHPASVILQWALDGEEPPALPDAVGEDPVFLENLLTAPGYAAERQALHILSGAPHSVHGTVDDLELQGDVLGITEPDFVREGIAFLPPTRLGPRALPSGAFGESSDVFLIGREIRFFAPGAGAGEPQELLGTARIAGFDPRGSRATAKDFRGEPGARLPAAGFPYELDAGGGVLRLASSREGLLHTFLWDSFADTSRAGARLTSRIKLMATGIDSERGPASFQSVFNLESGLLVKNQSLLLVIGSREIAAGDINGDGRNELVVGGASREIQIFSRKNWITFGESTSQVIEAPVEGSPRFVATGDVTGDGLPDVLAAVYQKDSPNDDLVCLYRQDPALPQRIPSRPTQELATGCEVLCMAIADVAGDKANDVIVAAYHFATARYRLDVYRSAGGQLQAPPEISSELDEEPVSVAAGDLEGNGSIEIVLGTKRGSGENSLHVLSGGGGGTFQTRTVAKVGKGNPLIALGAVEGGGGKSIVMAHGQGDTITVFSGDLGLLRTLRADGNPVAVSTGDFNGDRLEDVIVAHEMLTAGVYLQDAADHTLPERISFDVRLGDGVMPKDLAVGEMTGDTLDDVAIVSTLDPITVAADIYAQSLRNPLPFGHASFLEAGLYPIAIATGDVTGDGRSDIAVVSSVSSTISVFAQSSFGTFAATPSYTIPTDLIFSDWFDAALERSSEILAIGDATGDGLNDIAVANYGSDCVNAYTYRVADDAFDPAPIATLRGGKRPRSVRIADVNGDGRNDVLVAYGGSGTLVVYDGDGMGGFGVGTTYTVGGNPNSIAVGDVDGDGKTNVAVSDETGAAIAIFHQTPSGLQEGPSRVWYGSQKSIRSVMIDDVNGDGWNDMVVLMAKPNEGYIHYHREGIGISAETYTTLGIGSAVKSGGIADIDGDGRNDLIVSSWGWQLLMWYQDAAGELGVPWSTGRCQNQIGTTVDELFGMVVGDVTGDGRQEVIGVGFTSHLVMLYGAR